MPFFAYLVKCRDKTFYCGYTNDLAKRLQAHNLGKGAKYTRGRTPVKLVYSEKFRSKGKALKREVEIKRLSRKEKAKLFEAKSLQTR